MLAGGQYVLYAQWEEANLCEVIFYNGSAVFDTQTINFGNVLTEPIKPVKEGYIFVGWYIENGGKWDFETTVTSNMALHAKWGYTIEFDTNGGNEIENINVIDGEKAEKPSGPFKNGYAFIEWYLEPELMNEWDFETPVIGNMTLYAKWGYTVEFDTNGGNEIENIKVIDGERAEKPSDPEKDGYTFIGWYLEPELINEWDFETPVTGNMILYAEWELSNYEVIFYDGEEVVDSQIFEYGDIIAEPTDPEKEGYKFLGWYYIDDNGVEIKWNFETAQVLKDTVLHAKWKKNPIIPGWVIWLIIIIVVLLILLMVIIILNKRKKNDVKKERSQIKKK